MSRVLKFRAWDKCRNEMIYTSEKASFRIDFNGELFAVNYGVDGFTQSLPVMQFTGLHDKNGKELFEGDFIEYFDIDYYRQQSFAELAPEINEPIIIKRIGIVSYKNSRFIVDSIDKGHVEYPLSYVGLQDINEIRTFICGEDGIKQGLTCDFEGNEICDSIIGLKIIGNIFENGDLIK